MRRTRRQSQRWDQSRLVLAHESRQLPAWLIFDVGQYAAVHRRCILLFCVLSIAGYVASYALIRVSKPQWLLSHDKTPVQLFCGLFYPLRFIDATKPDWYWPSVVSGSWITVKVESNNLGNGRLYFDWDGKSRRAFFARDLGEIRESDVVRLRLSYRIESWDDFSSRLVETIDHIQKVPNKTPEPTPLPVTDRADARSAPGSVVAHLWRSAPLR